MSEILSSVQKLSDKHGLKTAPLKYVEGFAAAMTNVHPEAAHAKILQDRFFIPDDSKFNEDQFYQSAAELSVANHIKQQPVSTFATERKVNPPKDVDTYFERGSTIVAVEVKCPSAVEEAPEGAFTIKMAGRVPGYQERFDELQRDLASVGSGAVTILGKNRDVALKDYLVNAHNKFSPQSGVDHCNILFVACGHYFNMADWHMHLFQNEGLYTAKPFQPSASFRNVDVTIISNLKYFHSDAREHHDWTLKNVFMLAFVNPHARSTCMSSAVGDGLSVFDHHSKAFREYQPVCDNDEFAPQEMLEAIKVNHYVARLLPEAERLRYFPVPLRSST